MTYQLNATRDLKQDHLTLKRDRDIAQRCSEKLYADESISFEDLGIISVIMEEFVDRFHHGKEEQAYLPETMIFKSMVLQQDHSTSFFIH